MAPTRTRVPRGSRSRIGWLRSLSAQELSIIDVAVRRAFPAIRCVIIRGRKKEQRRNPKVPARVPNGALLDYQPRDAY